MRRIASTAVLLVVLGQSAAAWAAAAPEDGALEQVAYGVGSVFGTLVYGPIKGTFCALGTVASVATLILAGPDKAGQVAGRACRGTWVITPDVVKGKQPIELVGTTPSP